MIWTLITPNDRIDSSLIVVDDSGNIFNSRFGVRDINICMEVDICEGYLPSTNMGLEGCEIWVHMEIDWQRLQIKTSRGKGMWVKCRWWERNGQTKKWQGNWAYSKGGVWIQGCNISYNESWWPLQHLREIAHLIEWCSSLLCVPWMEGYNTLKDFTSKK